MIRVERDPVPLAAEWAALWGRARASPFQHPAWLLPWWEVWGPGIPAAIATLRGADGTLRALLPLYPFRDDGDPRLLPLGAGVSDLLDGVFTPDVTAGEAQHLVDAACDAAGLPADLFQLPADSPLAVGATGAGEPLSDLPLTDGWDAAIALGVLKDLRYFRRRAEREAGYAERAGTESDLPVLLELHAARWEAEAGGGAPGILADPDVERFLRRAASGLFASGLARLTLVELGGAPAAALLALGRPGWQGGWMTGLDPARRALAPGVLALGAALRGAEAAGAIRFSALRGDEPH